MPWQSIGLTCPALALAFLAALPARAQTALEYECGGELAFFVQVVPEAGTGRFEGPFAAGLVPDQQGAWVNPGREVQFYPEEMPPLLWLGAEQFTCSALIAGAGSAN